MFFHTSDTRKNYWYFYDNLETRSLLVITIINGVIECLGGRCDNYIMLAGRVGRYSILRFLFNFYDFICINSPDLRYIWSRMSI